MNTRYIILHKSLVQLFFGFFAGLCALAVERKTFMYKLFMLVLLLSFVTIQVSVQFRL